MKGKIFMYLFLFALLYAIFQYVNSKRYYKVKKEEIAELQREIDSLEAKTESFDAKMDSLDGQQSESLRGFSLKTNDKAREFFEDQNMSVDSMAAKIESAIISKNTVNEDNPLVPYSGVSGVMRINRIKILNSRWIIAEFTDGTYWGEALISYYLNKDNNLEFETDDGVLYAKGIK